MATRQTLAALLLAACGGGGSTDSTPDPQSHRRQVSRAEFGDEWPLTVESGEIECIPIEHPRLKLGMVVFHHDGKTYALNGTARDRVGKPGYNYLEIDPIWKDHPTIHGAKVSIGPLIDAGLELCD